MSNVSLRLKAEELRSLAFGSVGVGYASVGTPLEFDSVIFHLQNATNSDLLVSYDQEVDHEYVAAGGFLLLDCSANRSSVSTTRVIPGGTQIQVRQGPSGAPSSGSVYLSTYYAEDRD